MTWRLSSSVATSLVQATTTSLTNRARSPLMGPLLIVCPGSQSDLFVFQRSFKILNQRKEYSPIPPCLSPY